MIVSSVYSWLKEIRSTFDIYEVKKEKLNKQAKKNCSSCTAIMPQYTENQQCELFNDDLDTVLLRNHLRRSYPYKKNKHVYIVQQNCFNTSQQRVKKAWSVGDAWGIDFQLSKDLNYKNIKDNKDVKDDIPQENQRVEVEMEEFNIFSEENVQEVLQEFAFLSDVEQDELLDIPNSPKEDKYPVYVNISTISNSNLRNQIEKQAQDTISISSTESFVTLSPNESDTSGTYTLDQSEFQSSKSSLNSGYSINSNSNVVTEDKELWKCENWQIQGPKYQQEDTEKNPIDVKLRKHPLKKGKSLESFNLRPLAIYDKNTELFQEVELRTKHNRKSVIPILEETRKAIILPKDNNNRQYMHIWECYTPKQQDNDVKSKPTPAPAPRTKLLHPAGRKAPKPAPRTLILKQARENIVSFAFDETVEIFPLKEMKVAPVKDETRMYPSQDIKEWMQRLKTICEWESEPEMEIPPGYDTSGYYASTSSQQTQQTSPNDRKFSKTHKFPEVSPIDKKQTKGNLSPEQRRYDGDKTSQDHKDNKFDFNNVIKYKIDKQTVKVSKNDVIEQQGRKLLHTNHEGTKTLAENIEECRFEQKSPKEHVLIRPDNKKIQFYKDKKPSSSNSTSSSSFNNDYNISPSRIDNGVRSRFMQFFKIRPSATDLYEKGIYKNETVFGNTLLQLEKRDGTPVPLLVKKCIDCVEMPCNIISDGLYRTSASLATLQDLRFAINKTYAKDLDNLLKSHETSADVPSGLLKLFIRELKESLIGQDEFHKFHIIHGSNDPISQKYSDVLKIIECMPTAHRETLKTLLRHLSKVIAHKDKNGMSAESIGICWGQTMIGGEDGSDAVMMACRKNEVVQLLLEVFISESTQTCTEITQQSCKPCKPTKILQKQISEDVAMTKTTADCDKPKEKLSLKMSSQSLHNLNSTDFQTNPGSSVHEIALKLQNSLIFSSMSKSVESLDSLSNSGSITSLYIISTNTIPFQRLRFMKDLILRIENFEDFKGVYRGRGNKKIVEKILRKSKKEKSKEFGKLMANADIFVLADVLKEVVKECHYQMEFNDMEVLVQNKEKHKMREVINSIPNNITLVFKHLDILLKKCKTEAESLTTLQDVYECWWPILIGKPVDTPTQHDLFSYGFTEQKKREQVGRSQHIFKQLIDVIIEQGIINEKMISTSMYDLTSLSCKLNNSNKLDDPSLCCMGSNHRLTSIYSQKDHQSTK